MRKQFIVVSLAIVSALIMHNIAFAQKIDYPDYPGRWYMTDDTTGEMLHNQWVQVDGKWYFVDQDSGAQIVGSWIKDVDGNWYYASGMSNETPGAIFTSGTWNFQTYSGYYDVASGTTIFTDVAGGKYSFNENGAYISSDDSDTTNNNTDTTNTRYDVKASVRVGDAVKIDGYFEYLVGTVLQATDEECLVYWTCYKSVVTGQDTTYTQNHMMSEWLIGYTPGMTSWVSLYDVKKY